MARNKFKSPTITITITRAQVEHAKRSNSTACLIADAIKTQHPYLSNVSSDMATVRASDHSRKERYVYLQTPDGQHVLLAWDQGWDQDDCTLTYRRAVQILPTHHYDRNAADRQARIAQLEAMEAAGTIKDRDKAALTRMRNADANPDTPRGTVRRTVQARRNGARPVIHGGPAIPTGKKHPNLLANSDRHYGAKIAEPGKVFSEAVDQAVTERLAQLASSKKADATA